MADGTSNQPLMTAREVAAYLQVTTLFVYRSGLREIAVGVSTRALRWRRDDVDRWLRLQKG